MPTPITVSVNFIDLTGNAITGYMTASVVSPSGVYDLFVTGLGIIAPKTTTSTQGTTVSVTIWGNDVIVDMVDGALDTYYTVNLFNSQNVLIWSAAYLFTGSGPINLVGFPSLTTLPAPPTTSLPALVPVPGGNNGDVQFNNGGVFAGTDNLKYDSGTSVLSVNTIPVVVGTLSTGQVAFGSATNTVAGDANLTWDSVNGQLLAVSLMGAGIPIYAYVPGSATLNTTALQGDAVTLGDAGGTIGAVGVRGLGSDLGTNTNPALVIVGVSGVASHQSPKALTQCNAMSTDILIATLAGTITEVDGINIGPVHHTATSTGARVFGIFVDDQASGSFPAALCAGIYLAPQSNSMWAIYSAGASPSRFGGNFSLINGIAATNILNQSAPAFEMDGAYWDGAASQLASFKITRTVAAGTNPNMQTNFINAGYGGGGSFVFNAAVSVGGNISGNQVQTGTNFLLYGNTPATGGGNINFGALQLRGNYWDGAASQVDSWSVTPTLGAGTNPTSTLIFSHTGTPGQSILSIPVLALRELAAPSGVASSDLLWADSTVHRLRMNNNNGTADTVAGLRDIGQTAGLHNYFSDLFFRSAGNLGGNYTDYSNSMSVSGGVATGTSAGFYNIVAYTGSTTVPTQDVTAFVAPPSGGGYQGVGTRISGTPGVSVNGYFCVEDTTTLYLLKATGVTPAGGGSTSVLTSTAITTSSLDKIRMQVVGNTITCWFNDVEKLQVNDSSSPYTTGYPALVSFGNNGSTNSFLLNNPNAPGGATINVVIDGDSTASGGTISSPWSNYLFFSKGQTPYIANVAVPGKGLGTALSAMSSGTIETMLVTGSSVIDTLYVGGIPNILVILGGGNDIANGVSAATTYGYLTTYVAARQAAGWKVIVVPLLSRSTYDTVMQAYNQTVFANAAGANAISNLQVSMTGTGASANTFFFTDGIHPSQAASISVLAKDVTATISSLFI